MVQLVYKSENIILLHTAPQKHCTRLTKTIMHDDYVSIELIIISHCIKTAHKIAPQIFLKYLQVKLVSALLFQISDLVNIVYYSKVVFNL